MTRRCGSSKPIPTPLPCEATKPQEKCEGRKAQTKNGRRGKRYRTLHRMAGSTGARAITFRRLARETGKEKRENGNYAEKIEKKTTAKTLGSKTEEESKTSRARPQAVAKAYQSALRTKPNSRARNGRGASPCGGDVENGRRIARSIPP